MDSLGGNTKTTLIAAVNSVSDCASETISTLKFADRAKQIMVKVQANSVNAADDALVAKLQKEVQHLKEILNLKIKRRESFRPFAPSILREEVANWFEEEDDVPFMMKVFQIRKEKRLKIPAVAHVDGSGRLQTVMKDTNPLYHKLICAFQTLTEVPILLNTSFNENEPVVCRVEEAINTFLRTKMDVLVLGNNFLER